MLTFILALFAILMVISAIAVITQYLLGLFMFPVWLITQRTLPDGCDLAELSFEFEHLAWMGYHAYVGIACTGFIVALFSYLIP